METREIEIKNILIDSPIFTAPSHFVLKSLCL